MINIDDNILSKLKGKYFHKSIQYIAITIVFTVGVLTYLIIFHIDKLTQFIQALIL